MPLGDPPVDLPLPFPLDCERPGRLPRFPFPLPSLEDLVRVVDWELVRSPEKERVEDERPRPLPFRWESERPFPLDLPLDLPLPSGEAEGVLPRFPPFPPFPLPEGRGEGLGEALCFFFLTEPFLS